MLKNLFFKLRYSRWCTLNFHATAVLPETTEQTGKDGKAVSIQGELFLKRLLHPVSMPILIVRAMRLTIFLTLVCVANLYANGYSQEKLSVNLKNAKLSQVFTIIQQKTSYQFIYNNEDVQHAPDVSVSVYNATVPQILAACFTRDYPLQYRIKDSTVVVLRKPFVPIAVESPAKIKVPQFVVKGKVTDSLGNPLVGVSVRVNGSSIGTITDENGKFTLTVPDNAVITISYIGFIKREISTNGKDQFNIILKRNNTQLQDVVITAFAKQKKLTVTGAVSTISGEAIVDEPVANVTNALIGQVPGVNGLQASGEPGHNSSNIRIRGIATYGNSDPLVVIDGVEQSAEQAFTALNGIDPNAIASISILKDASATAVYGIRAANGVIIVTTKRGRVGDTKVSLTGNYGISLPTIRMHGLDSYHWALMRNEAINWELKSDESQGGLSAGLFSDDALWKLKHNRDYTPEEVDAMNLTDEQKARLKASPTIYYGSYDVYKQLFGGYGPQYQLNLNVSGGTEKIRYFTSLGFFDQESFLRKIDYYSMSTRSGYRRYNFRSNFDIDVVKNLTISLNLSGQFGKMQGPGGGRDPYNLTGRYQDMMHLVLEGNPIQSLPMIDGHLLAGLRGQNGSPGNPLGGIIASEKGSLNNIYYIMTSGIGSLYNNLLDNTIRVNYKMPYLLKGLSIRGTASYQDNYTKHTTLFPSFPVFSVLRNREDPSKLAYFGGGYSSDNFSNGGYSTWNKFYLDLGFNYTGSFDRHHVTALILGKASKYTMPNDDFNTPSGIMGLVGRLVYNYDNRYLAEVNMGYNGTEQFRKGHRFSLFPAFSAGWIPTLEPFFPQNHVLSFLKIRGSYGLVGNDLLGNTDRRYLYLPNTYNLNEGGYYLGGSDGTTANSYYPGAGEGAIGNPAITWEKARKLDIGLESIFFDNRLTINFDLFRQKRDNILTVLGIIPMVYGVDADDVPPANVGKTENKGYEILVRWEDKLGDFGYAVEGHLTHTKNKVIYKAEAPNPYDWMNETGKSIGQRFGVLSDGLYNTTKELNNRSFNTFSGNIATVGDIRYIDLNGDGLVNNMDVAPIGYPGFPEYSFGIKLHLDYKGVSVSALFNGSMHGSYYLDAGLADTYSQHAGNAFQWQWDMRWTPEKAVAGENIGFPRPIYGASSSHNNLVQSDFWIIPTDFLRLKNINISYTFSAKRGVLSLLGISELKVYLSGYNIYTFQNDMSKYGLDPESSMGGKYIYPLISTYNLGFNLQF